jgi:hypothetical protein
MELYPQPRQARPSRMNTLSFYRRVIEETGQRSREAVKRGMAAVFQALRD